MPRLLHNVILVALNAVIGSVAGEEEVTGRVCGGNKTFYHDGDEEVEQDYLNEVHEQHEEPCKHHKIDRRLKIRDVERTKLREM